MTSAEANKLLKTLNEDMESLCKEEALVREFNVASGEDEEKLRPEYDYEEVQDRLADLGEKIRKVKHAINVFNTTTTVPGFDMTIDEALVFLPQLHKRVTKLADMKAKPVRRRCEERYGAKPYVDYVVINYDRNEVVQDHEEARDLLKKLQLAIDAVNTTETFEVDI